MAAAEQQRTAAQRTAALFAAELAAAAQWAPQRLDAVVPLVGVGRRLGLLGGGVDLADELVRLRCHADGAGSACRFACVQGRAPRRQRPNWSKSCVRRCRALVCACAVGALRAAPRTLGIRGAAQGERPAQR